MGWISARESAGGGDRARKGGISEQLYEKLHGVDSGVAEALDFSAIIAEKRGAAPARHARVGLRGGHALAHGSG